MYVDCFKNCGKPYLRIMHNYYSNVDGKVKITRKTIKNLGPLSKYDDGKPDFLKRFREKFNNNELDFCSNLEIPNKELDERINLSDINFTLNPKNIGYLLLNSIFNELGIYGVSIDIRTRKFTQSGIICHNCERRSVLWKGRIKNMMKTIKKI